MTLSDFWDLTSEFREKRDSLMATKGSDYRGTEDALANFKQVGAALGMEPKQVLAVYLYKQISAILRYCSGEELKSEGIESRLHDAGNYIELLWGLIVEENAESQKRGKRKRG